MQWYKQWRHTVAQNHEQISRAARRQLVGIKGTQANYCTMHDRI